MQPKHLNYTYSKFSIVESQSSITKIKNNLKCSIQELREEKKWTLRSLWFDFLFDISMTNSSVFIIIFTIIIGWSLNLPEYTRRCMWFL